MSELISGKDALIALANGKDVIYINEKYKDYGIDEWDNAKDCAVSEIINNQWIFKLKPKKVILNGIEIPATFKPKPKDVFYYLDGAHAEGFSWRKMHDDTPPWFFENPTWRTEEEIKQVVAALREAFK